MNEILLFGIGFGLVGAGYYLGRQDIERMKNELRSLALKLGDEIDAEAKRKREEVVDVVCQRFIDDGYIKTGIDSDGDVTLIKIADVEYAIADRIIRDMHNGKEGQTR